MPRLAIADPSPVLFATELTVRVTDLNYGGHLGNDAVLGLAHEARVRFLAAHGLSELDVDGLGLLMVDAAVLYRAEGRLGMRLRVEVGAAEVRTRGCELVYRITDAAGGAEIARASTGLVVRDPTSGKLVRLPERLLELLAPGH
jgi:acyl-CoA thioesterase FadM